MASNVSDRCYDIEVGEGHGQIYFKPVLEVVTRTPPTVFYHRYSQVVQRLLIV